MDQICNMANIQRGDRLRRSPFFESTQKYGAKAYTVYNHMLFPIHFDDFEAEYWKVVQDVTLWDVCVERQVEITGKDACAFTNLLTPRDLTKCQVGQGKYLVITDDAGGILNDPVMLRLGENHFWLALADSDLLYWAKGVAFKTAMDVTIKEPDVSPLQIQGPKAKGVVEALFGEAALRLGYYRFMETDLDGIPVVVTRTGWSGEIGYEIYLRDGRRGNELWEKVMEAGRPFNIAPTGPVDIRRIEAGILNYGADMTLENNPYEVGLDWMIDFNQEADFIGREALQRIQREGVKRRLVGVEISGEPVEMNMIPWNVGNEKEIIGTITSAAFSPRLEKNIGYAMLPVENSALGNRLVATLPGQERREVTVAAKPFIDPKKDIPKS